MNTQFNFKEIFESKEHAISALGNFWKKIYKLVLLLFLVVAVFLGSYVWQKSLSRGEWSQEKKQEYLKTESKGVVFNEDDFKKASDDVSRRRQEIVLDQGAIKDIFK